ncbi:MAG: electron transfer flavoprotein subunit alpha/FixB family protein [bacterium]
MIDVNREGEVWVAAEMGDDRPADVSLELLGKARELADRLGVPLAAVLMGHQVRESAPTLINHGADRVYLANHRLLDPYQTSAHARVLIDLIREHRPQILLYGATSVGRDLAPRVASAVKAGLTADCTDLEIGSHREPGGAEYEDLLLQIRPAFGGNIIATIVNFDRWPQMATVREGVMPLQEPDYSRRGEIIPVPVELTPADAAVDLISRTVHARGGQLKGARVVVAGGAGMGNRAGFDLLWELAGALGGQVAGSRAAVDAGWVDAGRQVGQTGLTVRPALYIAAGISGAVQHLAGMSEAKKIIAINIDPEAPILEVANYGIVGDAKKVVPMMIEAVKARV